MSSAALDLSSLSVVDLSIGGSDTGGSVPARQPRQRQPHERPEPCDVATIDVAKAAAEQSVVVRGVKYYFDCDFDPVNGFTASAWREGAGGEIEFESSGNDRLEAVAALFTKMGIEGDLPACLQLNDMPSTAPEPSSGVLAASVGPRNPLTGKQIDLMDADSLIDAYAMINEFGKTIDSVKQMIREALGAMATEGEGKTRRVIGRRRAARIEMPNDSWDNSMLKECWNSYEKFRDQYLRIEKIAPKLTEVKKLMGTNGTPDLNTFREMVRKANRGPQGLPTITVEK